MSARSVDSPESRATALPGVRLKLPCRDLSTFLLQHAPGLRASGVVVAAGRLRPIGARVRLKIELRDGSLGYAGEAVVAAHEGKPAKGMRLSLREPILEPLPPGSARQPAAEALPRSGVTGESRPLVDSLFADLGSELADDDRSEALNRGAARARWVPNASGADGDSREGDRVGSEAPGRQEETPSPGGANRWFADVARESPPAPAAAESLHDALRMGESLPPPAAVESPEPPSARRAAQPARWFYAAVAMVAIGAGAGASIAIGAHRIEKEREARLTAEIRAADACLMGGRLVEPRKDSALEHLLAAKAVRADDRRVIGRLEVLADKCVDLGARALRRGDLEEAAAHYDAALRAVPGRDSVRAVLGRIEERRRGARSTPGRP